MSKVVNLQEYRKLRSLRASAGCRTVLPGISIAKTMWEIGLERDVAKCKTLSDDALKALWDRYDGANMPDDIYPEAVHCALNERGLGSYCAA